MRRDHKAQTADRRRQTADGRRQTADAHKLPCVARLPYVDPAKASPDVREALERVPPLNIFRMTAQADSAFVPWLRWAGVLLSRLELDPLLRELAILRVARLTPDAEYEWVQHVPIAKGVGAT